jgi:regulator of sirC expression with transglutaminase-like and TPR domain
MDETNNIRNLNALINLLEDSEEEVWLLALEKLTELGTDIIPYLEKSWELCLNTVLQERIENIIQDIQFRSVCQDLYNWDLMGGTDLLKGACIVARMQYPDLKHESLLDEIIKIKNDVWLNLNYNLTALEKVKVINHIFYITHKYSGNYSNYYTPQNYFINQVIATKKGNPVSLGIVYLTLAKLLEIPIFGINLPKNFILAYKDVDEQKHRDSILFYINPFNKGAILGKREIDYFLNQQKIEPEESYYYPCTNFDIIERLIFNLINSHETIGQIEKVQKYKKLLKIFKRVT